MAIIVIYEWVLSTDEKLRYDGIFITNEFNLKEIVPALRELILRLQNCASPGAPYEQKKALRVIESIGG